MMLIERFWATITIVVNWLTLSPIDALGGSQYPIIPKVDLLHSADSPINYNIDPDLEYRMLKDGKGPSFKPPTGRRKGYEGSELRCEYPTLGPNWIPCSTSVDRKCWLKNTKTGEQYNITTDYEKFAPPGVVRNYTLVLSNKTINLDGIDFPYGKLFSFNFPEGREYDGDFPGPLIQACWGDILNITVYNRLPAKIGKNEIDNRNGTSIHWHGLRMLNNMPFDGVNGVTQCPIAPGDHFTYTFPIMQYGTTWYHSHYAMQYADGTQGPLMLHGPTSAPFDLPLYPFIITDWGHNSAFQAMYNPPKLIKPSLVLNGYGNIYRFSGAPINKAETPPTYNVTFEPGKRYLLRIINTSFSTGITFAIDGHKFQVVSTDLVPVEPFPRDHLVVHIGQRYNIIVQAKQKSEIADGNFWIRTEICGQNAIKPGQNATDYMKTGIVRYNNQSKDDPKSSGPPAPSCADEPLENIFPTVKWVVGQSKNSITKGENFAMARKKSKDYILAEWLWDIKETKSTSAKSFQIQYNNPMFLRLANPSPEKAEVAVFSSENYTETDWAYIVINGGNGHPIHLHGHDFAVVYHSDKPYSPGDIKETCPNNKKFRCNNPPRRDVIMPAPKTYTVIVFRTDNPGSWLMHCHIAAHAGEGLAFQILERPTAAADMWPSSHPVFVEAQRVCKNWNTWWDNAKIIQDDSGI